VDRNALNSKGAVALRSWEEQALMIALHGVMASFFALDLFSTREHYQKIFGRFHGELNEFTPFFGAAHLGFVI
jgi:hypothetical protein